MNETNESGILIGLAVKAVVDLLRNRVALDGRYVHVAVVGVSLVAAAVAVKLSPTVSLYDYLDVAGMIATIVLTAIGVNEITPRASILPAK